MFLTSLSSNVFCCKAGEAVRLGGVPDRGGERPRLAWAAEARADRPGPGRDDAAFSTVGRSWYLSGVGTRLTGERESEFDGEPGMGEARRAIEACRELGRSAAGDPDRAERLGEPDLASGRG